jgi:hypothetical protein
MKSEFFFPRSKLSIISRCLASLLLPCALLSSAVSAGETDPTVNEFADLLVGVFDSSAQAIDDSSYLDVTVQHCPVTVTDLPQDKNSGRFLVVRQSVSTSSRPYRLRLLRIFAGPSKGTVLTSSFAAKDNFDFSDLCFKPESERLVSFSQFTEEKCTTFAQSLNGIFVGGTPVEGCPNSRSGAVRMTSELKLSTQGMTTWDRGYNAAGQLVWGPESGPYQFERVSEQDVRLAQLASFFSGRFSNEEQVALDPKNFTPVSYEYCQIDVAQNPLRPKTRLMLARQTITTPTRTIQRNRIYEFFRSNEGHISIRTNPFDESKVPDDICQRPLNERRSLPNEILSKKDSCVLKFNWDEASESFAGGTPPEGCPSNFQGSVKFVLSEVIKDGVISPWEKWLNAQDEIVAGSKLGPYIYKRIKP